MRPPLSFMPSPVIRASLYEYGGVRLFHMDISPLRYRAKYEYSHPFPQGANDQHGTGTFWKWAGRTLPDEE